MKLATSNYRSTLLKLEAIGQSHDVRLHEVKDIIVNEHKAIEKKKQEVNELKTILAEQDVQSDQRQQRLNYTVLVCRGYYPTILMHLLSSKMCVLNIYHINTAKKCLKNQIRLVQNKC